MSMCVCNVLCILNKKLKKQDQNGGLDKFLNKFDRVLFMSFIYKH